MKHMTLAEFIETESDEPVFIVDGPQPICATRDWVVAEEWRNRATLYFAMSSHNRPPENQ